MYSRKKFFWLYAAVVPTAVFLLLLFERERHRGELTYQGRFIEAWLDEYSSPTGHENAKVALDTIGTNAVPHLIRMLETRDSHSRRVLLKIPIAGSFTERWFPPAELKWKRALTGFRAIQVRDDSILPRLLEVCNEDNYMYAMSAITSFGKSAVATLSNIYVSASPPLRSYAVYELSLLKSKAAAFVASSMATNDADQDVKRAAIAALRTME